MVETTTIETTGTATERTALVAPGLLAVLLGAFLVLGAGFAPIAALHDAAHDSRHSFAFPCH
jgi:cobalt transporter subunit CbtB